jgi:hypothetical protein
MSPLPSVIVTPAAPFEYEDLPAPVSRFLKLQVDRIHQCARASILKIGADLLLAKPHLSHGMFIRWVESEVGLSARTAQGYMQVAQWVESKGTKVAHLPTSVLYVLSAPSTPDDFVRNVLYDLDAGKEVSLKSIRARLKALRDSKRKEPALRKSRLPEGDQQRARVGNAETVLDAVTILVRNLAPSDFQVIRRIMTSRDILEDPKLGERILSAFECVESTAGKPDHG